MDLSTTVAGLTLEHPIMNAAGTCKTLMDVAKLASSAASAIVLGSITKERRDGNSGDVYWCGDTHSVNSLGMPNPGLAATEQHLPVMAKMVHDAGKKLIVSVAGFSPDEYALLAAAVLAAGADAAELNWGCPNVWQEGQQKRIVSFDAKLATEIIYRVGDATKAGDAIWVKLSPFSDPSFFKMMASILGRAWVYGVTTANTFPNVYAVDEKGKPRISPAEGLAGFAGRAYKPLALGQVRQIKPLLDPRQDVIGVGGIWNGADVRDFLAAGATAVQLATAYLERGEGVFSKILAEYVETMES